MRVLQVLHFSLSGLMFPAGSRRMKMLYIIHLKTGCPLWASVCSKVSFIQFFGRISLTELNHRKTELFHVMRHLHSPQIVKSNFFDVKFPPQFINEIFDKAIMSNITIKSFQIILLFPDILQVFLHQRLSCTYPISPFTHLLNLNLRNA